MGGTENQQDTSGATQDTSKGGKGTSEQTPKTFTEEEHNKAISDLSSEKGREIKALTQRADKAEKAAQSAQETISKWESEQDEKERKAAQGDDDALATYERKKQAREASLSLAKDRADFETEKATHQEDIDAARDTRREIEIWEIAGKHSVDASVLKQKVERFKLESKEDIEELAQTLTIPKAALTPDSSKTIGGEDLSSLTPDDKIKRSLDKLRKK